MSIIIRDIEQGSAEWGRIRLGIPTSSNFDKLITPAKLQPSTQADGYMTKLLAEWLSGRSTDTYQSPWMVRGSEMEAEARRFYEFEKNIEVEQVAFVYGDERRLWGASTDGLIGDEGVLEVKCPSQDVHMQYLRDETLPMAHRIQAHGELLATGRQWADVLSYHPGLPEFIFRVRRDTSVLMAITAALEPFIARMLAERNMWIERGHYPKEPL